jgi:hypothetical protein
MIARLRVEVDGIEDRAPHVVLALVVRTVADPDRSRPLVAGQVIERRLLELPAAIDPIHDLEVVLLARDIRDEVHEVARLPVEAERVEAPQRERRVADPCVPVVPVPLAAGRLRERGRRRRDDRPRRRVGQALERQCGTLEVGPPRMIRERAPGEPVLPVVGRPDEPPVGLLERLGRSDAAPGDRAKPALALRDQRASDRPRPLEAEVDVARHGEAQVDVAPVRAADELPIALADMLPPPQGPPVVEGRLAFERQLHFAVHAAGGPEQDVVGVVVRRRAAVRL